MVPGACSGSAVGADLWFRSAVSVDPCRPLGSHGYSYATQSDRLAVAAAHLRTLYDLARDNVLFVAISRPASGAPEYRELPVEPVSAQFLRRLDARNRAGDDIYVAVNPVRPRPPTRAHPSQWGRTRAHIREPLRVQLDVDSDGTDVVPALASDVLSGVVPAPHVILRSSPKKYQMLWNLPPSSADSARSAAAWTAPLAEYYSFLLARRYGADKTVYPVSTIMRVPGFYNRKLQYRDEPPLVRPCAQSPRQWFRPASSPRLAPFDFEPVQSVVRPADLRLAMEKFTPLRGAGPDDAAIAALQEKYRGDIAYSLDLHSDQARRRGMDTQLVLAGGREAVLRIVERLDAQDESLARSLASRPGAKRVSTAPGPGSSRPVAPKPPSPAPDPDVVVEPFRQQRDRARAAVVHGGGVPAAAPVWKLGKDGLPVLRRVAPTAREVGYGLGLHNKPLAGPDFKPRKASPVARPGGSQADFVDWGLTMQALEDRYSPDAVVLALVQRRDAGPDRKLDPYGYAVKTVSRAIDTCRRRAEEAGETWDPGDRGADAAAAVVAKHRGSRPPPAEPRAAPPSAIGSAEAADTFRAVRPSSRSSTRPS